MSEIAGLDFRTLLMQATRRRRLRFEGDAESFIARCLDLHNAPAGAMTLELASAGITGPSSVFEGKFGFFNCFLAPLTRQLEFARAAEALGSRWYLPETAYKPYPCCQLIHAFIEGAKQIRTELKEIGKPLDTIEQISCQLAEPGLTLVTEPGTARCGRPIRMRRASACLTGSPSACATSPTMPAGFALTARASPSSASATSPPAAPARHLSSGGCANDCERRVVGPPCCSADTSLGKA